MEEWYGNFNSGEWLNAILFPDDPTQLNYKTIGIAHHNDSIIPISCQIKLNANNMHKANLAAYKKLSGKPYYVSPLFCKECGGFYFKHNGSHNKFTQIDLKTEKIRDHVISKLGIDLTITCETHKNDGV